MGFDMNAFSLEGRTAWVTGGAYGIGKYNSVVAVVRLSELGEFARCLPVEFSRINDNSSDGGAVDADELGGGVHYYVGSVLYRAEQERRSKGVVNDKRDVVSVGDVSHCLYVYEVGVGVAEGLYEDELCLRADGLLKV